MTFSIVVAFIVFCVCTLPLLATLYYLLTEGGLSPDGWNIFVGCFAVWSFTGWYLWG